VPQAIDALADVIIGGPGLSGGPQMAKSVQAYNV